MATLVHEQVAWWKVAVGNVRNLEVPMLVKVNATIVDSGSVASLAGLTAELFDKDVLSEDLLAKGTVTDRGEVEFLFDIDKATDLDSLGETSPDLFLTVRDGSGNLVFRSSIVPNVAFFGVDPTSGSPSSTRDVVFHRESSQ